VKIDSNANIQWQKSLGGSANELARSIQQTTDGGYIFVGYSDSNDGDVVGNQGIIDYWIVKLDNTGSIQWQKSLGGSNFDYGWSIRQAIDGGYIVAGYSNSNNGSVTSNHGSNDCWILKLNNLGNLQWQKSFGGSGFDYGWSIGQTIDGGYIILGNSSSNDGDLTFNHGGWDFWIVKLTGSSVGIEENTTQNLVLVYPNPSSGNIIIHTNKGIGGVYSIMNELGQTIKQIQLNSSNNYTINIDNLNNGIYFVVGYNNNEIVKQKIIVSK